MAAYKIAKNQTNHVDKGRFSVDFYIPLEKGLGFSCLSVDSHTGHDKTQVKNATRVYYVIEGEGTFDLEGKIQQVEPGDLFVIEEDSEYEYTGKMKLFEFNIQK